MISFMSIQKTYHEWLGVKSRNVEVGSECVVTCWNHIAIEGFF
jgi:hypothetical protein